MTTRLGTTRKISRLFAYAMTIGALAFALLGPPTGAAAQESTGQGRDVMVHQELTDKVLGLSSNLRNRLDRGNSLSALAQEFSSAEGAEPESAPNGFGPH